MMLSIGHKNNKSKISSTPSSRPHKLLEPEFISAKSSSTNRLWPASFTDESISLTRSELANIWKSKNKNHSSHSLLSLSPPSSPLSSPSSSTSSSSSKRSRLLNRNNNNNRCSSMISSNNILFKEMATLVSQNHPVQLALYLTRYYLDQMRNGFDVHSLAQLVLIKVSVKV